MSTLNQSNILFDFYILRLHEAISHIEFLLSIKSYRLAMKMSTFSTILQTWKDQFYSHSVKKYFSERKKPQFESNQVNGVTAFRWMRLDLLESLNVNRMK